MISSRQEFIHCRLASSLQTCLRPSTFCSCRPRLSTSTSALAVHHPRCSAAATRRHRAESRSVCVAVVVRGLLDSRWACFSDHHLVTCCLGVPPPPSSVTSSFTYRALRRIDKQAFCGDILQSRLYGSEQSDADEYADLFDAEVTHVLEIHAPLRTGRRRCSGKHHTYVLSHEAVERRYRRTRLPSDKRAFKAAYNAARTTIMTSRADHIKT